MKIQVFLKLTLSWRRPLSYRNQSIDLLRKSVDWFLYDNGLRHKRVKCSWKFRKFQWKTPALENTCVTGPQASNFAKNRLQHNCFTAKFLRTPFSAKQLWWLLFKISNSNNCSKCFGDISYARPIPDNLQLSHWLTNLKMHSLTKNVFR